MRGLVGLAFLGAALAPSAEALAAPGPCEIVSGTATIGIVEIPIQIIGPTPYLAVYIGLAEAQVADGCVAVMSGHIHLDIQLAPSTPCLPTGAGSVVSCAGAAGVYGSTAAAPPVVFDFVVAVAGVGPTGRYDEDDARCTIVEFQNPPTCELQT